MTDASSANRLAGRQLHFHRPVDLLRVAGCLRHWAADQRSPHIVLEARSRKGSVDYLLAAAPAAIEQISVTLKHTVGPTILPYDEPRQPVQAAGHLSASTRHRPLRVDDPEALVRATLSAFTEVRADEELVLQLVFGPRRVPRAVPNQSPSSVVRPWWQVAWQGNGGQIDGEKRSALRNKVADHGFACTIRLGVIAASRRRRRALLLSLLAAIRTSEASGVRLTLTPERPRQLNAAQAPWLWPLRLGVPELVGLTAWPLGDDELPGQPPLHPKPLPPTAGTTGNRRILATATAPGVAANLALNIRNAQHHLYVVGPTGAGKSTLLGGLISQDIADRRAVVVIEPKGHLVADVLARVPDERHGDIVILDPNDTAPVGLNPLATQGRRPEIVADSVLAIFKQLYGDAVGPRSQDILYAALLTLAQRGDASLVMLPLLLTNPGFRRSLTAGIRDPLTLEPFWAGFEAWSDGERAAAIAPVMNKLRPLLRPGLRTVLGQRAPRFDIRQVFTERKVLLVPLQRGIIGPEAAGLLGSLVVAELWHATQARSAIPAAKRHPVMIYVDELQDYLHLPTDLGEALAQARGYGVGFTLAHQYLDQLPREMRAAVLANARSRVCFQLPTEDAVVLAKGHPELLPADLTALGQYEIYASLFAGGQVTPYASGVTRRPTPARSDSDALRRASRERYGRPLDQIEAEFADLLGAADQPPGAPGRRRRPS